MKLKTKVSSNLYSCLFCYSEITCFNYQLKGGEYVTIKSAVNTFWTDLFANCFLCYENGSDEAGAPKNSLVHDDMLFFVNLNQNNSDKVSLFYSDREKKVRDVRTILIIRSGRSDAMCRIQFVPLQIY